MVIAATNCTAITDAGGVRMRADKRPVSTDALETLGTIIDERAGRDAIHLAVEPAVAAHGLGPGDDVGFVDGGVGYCPKPVGIVDPFLKTPVKKGERFWLVVYPRQITSLRHVWTHPAFPETPNVIPPDKAISEEYLRRFAKRLFSYYGDEDGENQLTMLLECAESGCFGTDIEYGDDCEPTAEFWEHFERYTGRKVKNRPTYFRCAC
jgi:hypothetical protein